MHPEVDIFLISFDIRISFGDHELVYLRSFNMNQQQTYRASSFYVGWMRGTLV